MHLLDVNTLIALVDSFHVHHDRVSRWFVKNHHAGWATCPLTENGFIRIVGNPQYPQGPGNSETARTLLESLRLQPGHQFWSDSVSLCDRRQFSVLPSSKDLTDFYLLALAKEHHARLATLDQRFDPSILPGGAASFFLIS
jgi:hypothetical protein